MNTTLNPTDTLPAQSLAEEELQLVREWYLKRWISYREYLRLTNLIF